MKLIACPLKPKQFDDKAASRARWSDIQMRESLPDATRFQRIDS